MISRVSSTEISLRCLFSAIRPHSLIHSLTLSLTHSFFQTHSFSSSLNDCYFSFQEVCQLLEYLNFNVMALKRLLQLHDEQYGWNMTHLYFDSRLGNREGERSSGKGRDSDRGGGGGGSSGKSELSGKYSSTAPLLFTSSSSSSSSTSSSPLLQLHHQEGIRAIIDIIKKGFTELYEARDTLTSTSLSLSLSPSLLNTASNTT